MASVFYYRAYNQAGQKISGTIKEFDLRAANVVLRDSGLRPYFLHDYRELKLVLRQRRKRRKRLLIGGAVAIALALVASGAMVGFAGRERAPNMQDLSATGFGEGLPGLIVADTKEERDFAKRIQELWEAFIPGLVEGVELKKLFMTLYVSRDVRKVDDTDLEVLATNTAKALQREFRLSGCTLWIVHNDETIMEVKYNTYAKSTTVKSYR